MKKRVLFVDNDPDFLDAWSEQLERADFEVFKATSVEEAEQILHNYWMHLAIVDLRLRNDNDAKDTSGLTLARKEAYRAVPKIILTRFTSYQYVREALGPAVEGLPPAVDYIYKLEESDAMMQALERAFTEFVRINWELIIRWEAQSSFFLIASLIEPEIDTAYIPDRANELEDLFRRLFYDSSQITISRLLARQQESVTLAISAFSAEGIVEEFVVTCSQKEIIRAEEDHYEKFAPKSAGEGNTVKVKSAETIHFAATAYTLVGEGVEEITTLAEFYRGGSDEVVTVALDYLFGKTLAAWSERGRFHADDKNLTELHMEWLGLSAPDLGKAELAQRLEHICREVRRTGLAEINYSPYRLTFYLVDGSAVFYPNPITSLSETEKIFTSPILSGIIHGQLNGDSVLVNHQGQTWLINFNKTGQGPLVCDFVSLETTIKIDLLVALNLQARYELEKRLLAVSRLDEEANFENLEPELQKALQAISRIRHWASVTLGHTIDPYLAGLLFCAVSRLATYIPTVQHTRRELMPYLHSMLSAAMLCQRLTPSPRKDLPPEAHYSIWIDETNKEVWVEGRKVELSPIEYDLLLVLYHRPNQLCTRQDISKEFHGVDHGPETEDAINTTMARLRKKIELDFKHSKYIVTVRGEGYRLELSSNSRSN